jgi:hypothetical protein
MAKKKRKAKGGGAHRAAYNSAHLTLYPHNVPAKRIYKRRKNARKKK